MLLNVYVCCCKSKHMKPKITFPHLVNLLIGAFIALSIGFAVLLVQVHTIPFGMHSGSVSTYTKKELPPIDPEVSWTLPHYRYRALTDSIKFVRLRKDGMLSTNFNVFFVGVQLNSRCTVCYLYPWNRKEENKTDYLIRLSGWKLDTGSYDQPVKYFVKGDQSYLRKKVCKELKPSPNKNIQSFACSETDVAVPFRVDSKTKDVMVPVSKLTFQIVKPALIVIGVLFFIYFIYFVLGSFIKLLIEIAQGDPFSERNIKRLRFIILNLFYIPFGLFVLNLMIMPLFFNAYFTTDVKLNNESWKSLGMPAILYLIFMALYTAFKKGKQLKEENDLTV